MSLRAEIERIETKLRTVFNKDRITSYDVVECNKLIEKWKKLTNYNTEKTPESNRESVIDDKPNWQN
jgi:hypothetical protein